LPLKAKGHTKSNGGYASKAFKGGKSMPALTQKPPSPLDTPSRRPSSAGSRSSFPQLEAAFTNVLEEFQSLVCDLAVPISQVDDYYKRLKYARQMCLACHLQDEHAHADAIDKAEQSMMTASPAVVAKDIPVQDVEQRRCKLLIDVVQLLSSNGSSMTMLALAAAPAVREAKKGVVAKLTVFLQKYPETFQIEDSDVDGKIFTMVRLVGELPDEVLAGARGGDNTVRGGTKRKKAPGAVLEQDMVKRQSLGDASEMRLSAEEREEKQTKLLQRIAEIVIEAEGSRKTLKDIGEDAMVKELRPGVTSRLKAFLEKYPEIFELSASDAGVPGEIFVKYCGGSE